MTVALLGAAAMMSLSSGHGSPLVVKPSSDTFTSVTVPVSPETTMGDG